MNIVDNKEKVLRVVDLTKKYNKFTLNKVNFSIEKGKITGFIGINGAGKTTTIKSIAGLVKPNEGDIYFWDEKLTEKNESRIRDRIGFLLDGEYYYPELTLKQMKKIFSKAYSNWDDKIFDALIERFDLPLKQKISKLSKGMKVKFSLALALSHHAEILIMDEPTSGLDPLVRTDLINMMKELAKKGVSVLFSSHITSDLEKIADDIILIDEGEIVFQEPIEVVENSHFVVKGNIDLLDSEKENLFLNLNKEKDKFTAIYKGDKDTILKEIPDAEISKANIEEVMLGYVLKGNEEFFKSI